MRMRVKLAGAALAAGLLVVACGPAEDAPAPTPVGGAAGAERAAAQILRVGNGAEPQTLDPHRAEGVPESNILRDLFEGLVGEAPDGSLVPGAAESWTISDDGLLYTFRIRADARWSNGAPVTARDFEFGLRRSRRTRRRCPCTRACCSRS